MERTVDNASGAGDGDWHERLGRAGFLAKGSLYGIIGVVAIAVAIDGRGKTTDQTGAMRSLADGGIGEALVIALALGLAGYALFRLVEVFEGPRDEDGAKALLLRVASLVRFVIYAALCVSAVRILTESSKGSGSESQTVSTVFDLPAGVALVFGAGVVMIGVGAYQGYKGVSTSFEEDLDTARMGERIRSIAQPLGVAGHVARAVVFVLIGAFLIKAAVEHQAKEAVGIDGALQEISQQTLGSALLFVIAIGLFLYGAFCLLEARYRKL